MPTPHLLILGGTEEAALLGDELTQAFPGWTVTFAQADDVFEGAQRVPAFTDAGALLGWVIDHEPVAVIDARGAQGFEVGAAVTHADLARPVPLLRLVRPEVAAADGPADDATTDATTDVATSIPEALLWIASVAAEVSQREGHARAHGDEGETPAGTSAALLRALGWAMSGDLDAVAGALDAGDPVDVDNPAGWPIPDLGSSLSPAHSQVSARVIVTDMNPSMAMQFSEGAPALILTPPSLVVGVEAAAGTPTVEVERRVRDLLERNLLASAAIAVLAPASLACADAVAAAARMLGVTSGGAPSTAGDAEAAVTASGASLVLPASTEGGVTVAVGRLAPAASPRG